MLALFFLLLALPGWATTPDYLSIPKPNPEPAVTGDTFLPPVTSAGALSDAGAPTIAACSQIVEVGRTFQMTGENLSVAYAWVQTTAGNGQWVTLTASTHSTENWLYYIPPSTLANSTFLIWAGSPLSYPFRSNATNIWWVQNNSSTTDDNLAAGDNFAVFGENLFYGGVNSKVYLGQSGVATTACPMISQAEGKLVATIPGGTANGTYDIWAHNGHGGEYGWSSCLGCVTVAAAQTWPGATLNLKTRGAFGDGIHDDTAVIVAALTTCAGTNGTVYAPAGNYLFNAALTTGSNTRILGDGPSQTTFQGVTNFAGAFVFGANSGQHIQHVQISGCAITAYSVNSSAMSGQSNYFNHFTWFGNLGFHNVSITCGLNAFDGTSISAVGMATGGGTNVIKYFNADNCNFYTYQLTLNGMNQSFVTNSNVYGRFDGGTIISQSVNGMDCENDRLLDYNASAADHSGNSSGRQFDLTNNGGGSRNIYWANNVSLGTGPSAFKSDQNAGEWLMVETGSNSNGVAITATSATLSTITIPGDGTSKYTSGFWYAQIIKGPGFGQASRITGDSAGVLTLATPWNEIPTSSSYVLISTPFENLFVTNNTKTGNGRAASTAGVEFYGTVLNGIAKGNSFTGVKTGIFNEANIYTPTQFGANNWDYFINNTMAGSLGIAMLQEAQYNAATSNKEGVFMTGNHYWDNIVTGSDAFNLLISDQNGGLGSTTEVGMDGTILQGTTGSGIGTGVANNAGATRQVNFIEAFNVWDTATPTSAASPTPTLTATATPSTTPTPSGVIRGYWRGETVPGRLVDSSGFGNDLSILANDPGNPSSPTAPEGLKWLGGGTTAGITHYSVPLGVFTNFAGGFVFETWLRMNSASTHPMDLLFAPDTNGNRLEYYVQKSSSVGQFIVASNSVDIPASVVNFSLDASHLVRVECGSNGSACSIIFDNQPVINFTRNWSFSPTSAHICDGTNIDGVFMDAVMIADLPSAIYPGPAFSVAGGYLGIKAYNLLKAFLGIIQYPNVKGY